jgi:hypothetical protein
MSAFKWIMAIFFGLIGVVFYSYHALYLAAIHTSFLPLAGMKALFLSEMTPAEVDYATAAPLWYVGLSALASSTGVIGSLLLIFRSAQARFILMLAFLGTVSAIGLGVFHFRELEVSGPELLQVYIIVAAVSLLLWLVSLFAAKQ